MMSVYVYVAVGAVLAFCLTCGMLVFIELCRDRRHNREYRAELDRISATRLKNTEADNWRRAWAEKDAECDVLKIRILVLERDLKRKNDLIEKWEGRRSSEID